MTCPAASSGCNGPNEGECMGLCLHRMPIQFAEPQDEGRMSRTVRAYKTHRPLGRFAAIKRAFNEWSSK